MGNYYVTFFTGPAKKIMSSCRSENRPSGLE